MTKKASENLEQYRKAHEEWDKRIGSARIQARSWRFACLLSVCVSILLIVGILMQLNMRQRYVYVAEVKPQESVVNIRPMSMAYTPTVAQNEAFIGDFIQRIMSVPLDPVVLRNNWLAAFQSIRAKATLQLNQFALQYKSFSDVGTLTKTVNIVNVNAVDDNSYDFTWSVRTINKDGKTTDITLYSGIFTLVESMPPKTMQEMLVNPLGLKIGYFSLSKKGSSQ
jgi:type IV secretion system protein TrbF